MGSDILTEKSAKSISKKNSADKIDLKDLKIEELFIEGYKKILKVTHEKTNLKAIIALHNSSLGPALGGIRIYPYKSFDHALEDVLRLSKGMTYKAAITEMGFGGGKSVIMADPKTGKTEALLRAFGKAVDSLRGNYICAEDVGCTVKDVAVVRKATRYVVGLDHKKGSGNPAPFTAWGVFRGIQSAVQKVYGTRSVKDKKIVVQGVGSVGEILAEILFWHGAKVVVSDVDQEKIFKLQKKFNFKSVSTDRVFEEECDVFSPCAMGGIINDSTLPLLKCKIVAGSANNQLLRSRHADLLKARGILYAPDFVINAGGLINVSYEVSKEGYSSQKSRNQIEKIYDILMSIYEISEKNNISTNQAAIDFCHYKIKYGIGKRTVEPHFHY